MIRAARRSVAFAGVAVFAAAAALLAQAPPPPVLTPVPKPAVPAAAAATPASQDASAVDPRLAGVPIYPGATFLQSFDIGSGQWVFVFGTNDPYASVVAFYKGQQLGRSTEVSKTPAIQQFDLGAFDSGKMTQRPSVLVKDFIWPDPAGYRHVVGTTETRYKTLIQIIPTTK